MSQKNPSNNQDLPRPPTGTFDGTWGEDVMNDDMTQKLEERLVARDTEGNLSNYTPYDEAIFIAADTGAVFDGDGTNWNKASRDYKSLTTGSLTITEEINYWPPVRIDSVTEISATPPPENYTTATLSALPSDASVALLATSAEGDGSADQYLVRIRENGSGREYDLQVSDWAGHSDFVGDTAPLECPVDPDNQVEYRGALGNISTLNVDVIGYY